MKLKLSDWASIAEVVGAIAIVISLIYVGVQVNDSTRGSVCHSKRNIDGNFVVVLGYRHQSPGYRSLSERDRES